MIYGLTFGDVQLYRKKTTYSTDIGIKEPILIDFPLKISDEGMQKLAVYAQVIVMEEKKDDKNNS